MLGPRPQRVHDPRGHGRPVRRLYHVCMHAAPALAAPPSRRASVGDHLRHWRQLRGELWAVLEAPLDDEARAIPLALAQDEAGKRQLKALQAAVAGVAEAHGLPEGTLASRRHLEALMAGPGWPAALEGWRRALLEGALAPLLAR